jgi:hypothetical protein
MSSVVGAVLPNEQMDWKPALSGMGMEKTIAVFNPLKDDFRVQYARSVASMPGVDPGIQFAREKAGLPLEKSTPQKHVVQYTILPAGQTTNLPGDIAQKAVQDLITYILSVRNKARVADPHARSEVEKEIVISIKNTVEFMNRVSPEEFTQSQLDKFNPETPTVEPVEAPQDTKTAAPDPAPGQGVSF